MADARLAYVNVNVNNLQRVGPNHMYKHRYRQTFVFEGVSSYDMMS